jgi:hypothetical protein
MHVHRVMGWRQRVRRRRDGDLIGRRRGRRKRLAERETHRGDLLLLRDDDFLRDALQLFVSAIAQQRLRHLDRSPVVGFHH